MSTRHHNNRSEKQKGHTPDRSDQANAHSGSQGHQGHESGALKAAAARTSVMTARVVRTGAAMERAGLRPNKAKGRLTTRPLVSSAGMAEQPRAGTLLQPRR
jgi:hypothetical protein